METLNIVVDPVIADTIRKNGLVEIALRRKDKKFSSFIKANITDLEVANEVGKTVSNSKKSLLNLSSRVRAISYIDLGLSLANLAIDTAGFIVIAQKMNDLSKHVGVIYEELGKLKNISVEDIRSNYEKLCLDYNSFVTKINDNDQLDRDAIEEYLKKAKAFISKLIRLLLNEDIDAEKLLNMIFALLPAYTSMLCIFFRSYYFDKRNIPLIYDNLKEVYEEIKDPKFRDKVQDYYLLDKNYNYRDVVDIIRIQSATIFDENLEIEDQIKLIEVFSNDESYRAFEKSLDYTVESEVKECVARINMSSNIVSTQ